MLALSVFSCMVVIVQSLIHVQLFVTPWTTACQASPSFTSPKVCSNSCPLSEWCYIPVSSSVPPLILLPSIFPSIRVFSNESALCIRWPKYQTFSFSINSSNKHSGLISFRIDWFDLLAVQGALMNLLQHQSLKASILQKIKNEIQDEPSSLSSI